MAPLILYSVTEDEGCGQATGIHANTEQEETKHSNMRIITGKKQSTGK